MTFNYFAHFAYGRCPPSWSKSSGTNNSAWLSTISLIISSVFRYFSGNPGFFFLPTHRAFHPLWYVKVDILQSHQSSQGEIMQQSWLYLNASCVPLEPCVLIIKAFHSNILAELPSHAHLALGWYSVHDHPLKRLVGVYRAVCWGPETWKDLLRPRNDLDRRTHGEVASSWKIPACWRNWSWENMKIENPNENTS